MRLAIVLPSRGLIYSRTIADVLREAGTLPHDWTTRLFLAHSRPLPDCFNEPTREALTWGAGLLWFVEEDMALPPGILAELINAGQPLTAADYPAGGQPSVHRDSRGEVMWTGTGCLLATADALREHGPFTTDHHWRNDGTGWAKTDGPSGYGGHDVNLGMAAYRSGHPVHVIDTPASQYRITRHATPGSNEHGWHDVATL